jgi:hypothetical protein
LSVRIASWLAWSLAGLCLIMAVATIVLSSLAQSAYSPGNWDAESGVGDSLIFVSFLAFPIVGALLASRRSPNPIGWICLILMAIRRPVLAWTYPMTRTPPANPAGRASPCLGAS